MKTVCFFLFWICSLSTLAQPVPDKQAVKAIMDRVNRYRLENPWQEFDNNWIRGTYYAGVMACYFATGDRSYLEQSEAFCRSLDWKLPVMPAWEGGSGANLLTCGQTMLECYLVDPEKHKIASIMDHLEDTTVKNPVSDPLEWYFEGGRRYVDGLFTGPPTLAMLHAVTGNGKYLYWMETLFWDVYGKLYDAEEELFYRDHRFFPDCLETRKNDPGWEGNHQVTASGKKVIWSRGNGWAFAGIARILKYLPADYPGYERYEEVFQKIARSLAVRQSEEGFWYPNLADPEHVPLKETSGTSFFIYGLAYGINQGILERDKYLPVVEKAWESVCDAVSEEGKVQWGQRVGDRPVMHKKEDSHEYVSGTFLLAASEVYQLAAD
jgi:rhamnogalacturonyl hydrolase YesR